MELVILLEDTVFALISTESQISITSFVTRGGGEGGVY